MAGINSLQLNYGSYTTSLNNYSSQVRNTGTGGLSTAELELKNRQNNINREVQAFHEAVDELSKQLKVFKKDAMFENLYKTAGTTDKFKSFALSSARNLVKAYNNINTFIKSSEYLTGEGKELLDGIQDLLQGKTAKDFAKMGITINKKTGEIKFDEQKFSTYLDEDVITVKNLLIDKANLAPTLNELVSNVTGKVDNYYFCKPVIIYA